MKSMFFVLLGLLASFASANENAEKGMQIPKGLIQLGAGSYYSPYAIVVDKTARKLTLWKQTESGMEKTLEFPSDMGKNMGNKAQRDDRRTPEGIYFIQKMLQEPEIPFDTYGKRAFTLDYPNLFDERAGKTGSGIWLHSIPDTVGLDRGSKGCVVIRNESIMALSPYVELTKTPVLIFESVAYQTLDKKNQEHQDIEKWLSQWIQAWKSKDIDAYINHYSESFRSLKMSKSQWKEFKAGLNQKYQDIDVSLYSPIIFEHGDDIMVRGLQAYRSSEKEDFGEKTLYLKREGGTFKIIAEHWVAIDNPNIIRTLAKCCSTNTASTN